MDFLTITWSFPSSPTSASVCRGPFPSKELMSESILNEIIDPTIFGNCSRIRSLASLYSNKNSIKVYHIMHWRTTTCTIKVPEDFPYIPFNKEMPITRVLGRVESENRVIDHSRHLLELILDQIARTTSTMIFWRVSAAMNL